MCVGVCGRFCASWMMESVGKKGEAALIKAHNGLGWLSIPQVCGIVTKNSSSRDQLETSKKMSNRIHGFTWRVSNENMSCHILPPKEKGNLTQEKISILKLMPHRFLMHASPSACRRACLILPPIAQIIPHPFSRVMLDL